MAAGGGIAGLVFSAATYQANIVNEDKFVAEELHPDGGRAFPSYPYILPPYTHHDVV